VQHWRVGPLKPVFVGDKPATSVPVHTQISSWLTPMAASADQHGSFLLFTSDHVTPARLYLPDLDMKLLNPFDKNAPACGGLAHLAGARAVQFR